MCKGISRVCWLSQGWAQLCKLQKQSLVTGGKCSISLGEALRAPSGVESNRVPNVCAPSASSEAMRASGDVEFKSAQIECTPSASSEAVKPRVMWVESLAEYNLKGPKPFANQSFLRMVGALPMQGPSRGDVRRSFAAGAYVHGGLFGLHNDTRLFHSRAQCSLSIYGAWLQMRTSQAS